MIFLLLLPAIVSLLALAAHFLRENALLFSFACLLLCILLAFRQCWIARLVQAIFVLGAFVWIYTTCALIRFRMMDGLDWKRAAIILLSVAAFSLLAAVLFQTPALRRYYAHHPPAPNPLPANS